MAKRGVFFQLYLNPRNERDQKIIAWIEGIPLGRRSKTIKEILQGLIQGHSNPQPHVRSKHIDHNATQVARKLFASFLQQQPPRSRGE